MFWDLPPHPKFFVTAPSGSLLTRIWAVHIRRASRRRYHTAGARGHHHTGIAVTHIVGTAKIFVAQFFATPKSYRFVGKFA